MSRQRLNSKTQNIKQIVSIIINDRKIKKTKKRKRKSIPKMRSAIEVAKSPQPYQFSMYTPQFPYIINHQPKASAISQNVANTFRNLQAVNNKELERLRGDLTAYRQEAQTIFKQPIAFPKKRVMFKKEIDEPIAVEEQEVVVEPIVEEPIVEEPIVEEPIVEEPTEKEEKIIIKKLKSSGGGLTETEIETDPEMLLPPRNPELDIPSRKYQRKEKNMAMIKKELRTNDVPFPSKIKAKPLRELAVSSGISLLL
jgi:hypothetical protein